ncbi:MAG: hypothetical protein AAF197_00070, partial [Pseudomonadota bacterium]
MNSKTANNIWTILGPGILYAAAAVGVSHLVQATRAGAMFGFSMAIIVLIACIVKYPAIRFGSEYAALAKQSLIHSYREQGWAAYSVYVVSQLTTMVFVVAAISLFTLGLIQAAFSFEISRITGVASLLAAMVVLFVSGGYRLIESLSKLIVLAFSALLIVAVWAVSQNLDPNVSLVASIPFDTATFLFVIALVGFMPSPTDASVLQSLWIRAKAQQSGAFPNIAAARLDFNVGYILSVILALAFVFLGSGILFGSGQQISPSNSGFAAQFLQLFTQTLGTWSFPIIASTAILVMVSTLMTVLDGMTRVATEILFGNREASVQRRIPTPFFFVLIVLCAAAVIVIA